MSKNANVFRLSALSVALLAAYAPVRADEVAELSQPDSSVSVGIGYVDNDRPQQGIYDAMRDRGFYGLFDADIVKRDEATGTWLTFKARNLGTENRELAAEWLRQGDIGAWVDYGRLTRDNPLRFQTGLLGIGGTTQVVSAAGANALPQHIVQLGTQRDQFRAGFYKSLGNGLDIKVAFRHEEKTGTRQWGRGGQPEFAVEPIDSTTRQLDATLNYADKKLQLSGGYQGTWFDNNHGLVDTYYRGADLTNVNNHIYLSLPLDNEAHKFFVNAGYALTPATRVTFKASHTKATQDERLPTSGIAGLPLAGSPGSLDGRLDTTLVQLGLTARPLPQLSLLANLRYHEVDDKTPTRRFVDSGGTTVSNTPYSYETKSGKFEATYRLPAGFSVTGGVDVKEQDRPLPVGRFVSGVDMERFVPHRAEVDETTSRLQLKRSLSESLNGSVTYSHAKRKGTTLSLTESELFDLISPLHIVDRKRDKWKLMLDWTPMQALAFQLNVEESKDDYRNTRERPYGLQDGRARMISLDASYSLGENFQLTAWLARDETTANQLNGRWTRGTEQFEAEHAAALEDSGESLGFGLRAKLSSKLKGGVDVQLTRNESRYRDQVFLTGNAGANGYRTVYPTSAGVTAVPLKDIHNKLRRLALFANYTLDKNADLRFDMVYEHWQTDDWSWLFADGSAFRYGGATNDQTRVFSNPYQQSTFLGARYIYKFR